MASKWKYRVTIVDHVNEKSTLTFNLGTITDASFGAEAALAETASQAILAELVDVVDGFIRAERLICDYADDDQLPAADTEYVTTQAVVPVHLNAPTQAPKIHIMRIPTASDGMFLADGVTVDALDADLVAYVAAVAANAVESDGEVIDTSSGPNTNGIGNNGYKLSVKRKMDGQ